jgi:DNA-binding LacI/PurR family transcriptional regulator
MNRSKQRARLSDVAKLADVSTGTASQALNGHEGVSAAARARVEAAAAKLGYRPHPSARRLARQRTEAIGVIFSAGLNALWAHLIYNGVIHGIMTVAAPAEYRLVFGVVEASPSGVELPRIVLDRDVDGVLTICCENPLVLREFARSGLPTVHIDTHGAPGARLAVDNDDEAGAFMGTCHLIQHGHRRVGLIAPPLTMLFGQAIVRGYERALVAAECRLDRNLVQEEGSSQSMEGGYAAMAVLLAQPDPPTAVFASSDYSAIGAIKAVRAAGLRVPDDVGVVGMDDLEMSAHVVPSLTTLHVDYEEMGRRAMQALLAQLRGHDDQLPRQAITPRLVVRESCGTHL